MVHASDKAYALWRTRIGVRRTNLFLVAYNIRVRGWARSACANGYNIRLIIIILHTVTLALTRQTTGETYRGRPYTAP